MMLLSLSRLLIDGRPDDHPVAMRKGEAIGFERFRADVMAAVSRFKACGTGVLACQDSYNFMVGFFGLLHAGSHVVLPQNIQAGTLQNLHKNNDLLIDDAMIEHIPAATVALAPLDPTGMVVHFFTSGSTGAPTRITKNLAMLECEIATLNEVWPQKVRGTVFATVSHQHIYGLTFKLLWPLASGQPFAADMHVLWETLLAELTPQAIIVSSPAHLGRLSGLASLTPRRHPKQIFSAGAPLTPSASQQAKEILGCLPTEIFGSTETGAIATRSSVHEDEPWRLLPGMDIRCEEGRMFLRSPFVGPEWTETADLIEPLPGGFRFLGRADRIVKIEGKRVALAEIERALERLPAVQAAAVVVMPGRPDRLAAVVVPSEDGRVTLSKIGNFRFGRFLRQALVSTQEAAGIPRLWRFVDKLPAQGMGKRRDSDILALFAGEP